MTIPWNGILLDFVSKFAHYGKIFGNVRKIFTVYCKKVL